MTIDAAVIGLHWQLIRFERTAERGWKLATVEQARISSPTYRARPWSCLPREDTRCLAYRTLDAGTHIPYRGLVNTSSTQWKQWRFRDRYAAPQGIFGCHQRLETRNDLTRLVRPTTSKRVLVDGGQSRQRTTLDPAQHVLKVAHGMGHSWVTSDQTYCA